MTSETKNYYLSPFAKDLPSALIKVKELQDEIIKVQYEKNIYKHTLQAILRMDPSCFVEELKELAERGLTVGKE